MHKYRKNPQEIQLLELLQEEDTERMAEVFN